MEKRYLVAVVLMFAVLYGYQTLFVPKKPASTRSVQAPQAQQPGTTTAPGVIAAPEMTGQPERQAGPAPAPVAEALVTDAADREISVDTRKVHAVFSNRGARLLHWVLKDYKDDRNQPLDLVPEAQNLPKPFSLVVADEAVTTRLNTALFKASTTGNLVDATREGVTLTFEFQDASGLEARKVFSLSPDSYIVTFSATVANNASTLNPAVMWGPGLGDVASAAPSGGFFSGNRYARAPQAFYYHDGKVQRVAAGKIPGQPVQLGDFRFSGVEDHYFLTSTVLAGPHKITYEPMVIPAPGATAGETFHYVSSTIEFAKGPQRVRYYFGPKDFDALKAIDGEFVRVIDFGMFAWLAVPLLGALQGVHTYVGNWGWSIIVLTILINLAMFPLRHKSVVSMRKMQELQPQLKAIQDRYANLGVTDPAKQKMNSEVMELYRSKGVNPASGCVPMLLTMPVLFAFYALLSEAVQLRGAHFGLWITDLSRQDPLYVTPVLMGLTMFWQQWITPSSVDPVQQRMMMFMPIMFSFMFMWAPSGLVLYWFVSNLWAIGQQYFTTWLIGPPKVAVARPIAERRVKNAGSGKSPGAK